MTAVKEVHDPEIERHRLIIIIACRFICEPTLNQIYLLLLFGFFAMIRGKLFILFSNHDHFKIQSILFLLPNPLKMLTGRYNKFTKQIN